VCQVAGTPIPLCNRRKLPHNYCVHTVFFSGLCLAQVLHWGDNAPVVQVGHFMDRWRTHICLCTSWCRPSVCAHTFSRVCAHTRPAGVVALSVRRILGRENIESHINHWLLGRFIRDGKCRRLCTRQKTQQLGDNYCAWWWVNGNPGGCKQKRMATRDLCAHTHDRSVYVHVYARAFTVGTHPRTRAPAHASARVLCTYHERTCNTMNNRQCRTGNNYAAPCLYCAYWANQSG
jgi:hypothetical protein